MSERHCPKCDRKFTQDVELCEDCQEPLVVDELVPTDEPPPMVLLTKVQEPAEAVILTNALRGEGIDAIAEEMDLLQVQMIDTESETGGIPVMVNAHDAERALEVLKAHREGRLSLSEDDIPPTAQSESGKAPSE